MSDKKTNGSGNGHDETGEEKSKILRFPSLSERKKMIQWRMGDAPDPRKAVPFFNFGQIPLFTKILLGIFLAVQILLTIVPEDLATQIVYTFGFVPGNFTGRITPFPYGALLSPITHIFIHGGWMHLAFNSVMAVSLGMFFEREFGMRRTIIFFFVCGLAGALAHFAFNPFSTAPMIGASGSISGLFGALIMVLGKRGGLGARTRSPWPLILFWVGFMALAGMLGGASTAWQAHIGGFLAGIGLLYLVQKGKIKL